MSLPPIYDPRHTTGVSPVHKDVKHPLVNDPRRPGQRRPLHGKYGHSRGKQLIGLFILLAALLAMLAVGLIVLSSALAGSE